MVSIKSVIYRTIMSLARMYWRLTGGRKIKAFGHELFLTPDSIFPSYWNLRLPAGDHLSKIVKYADYVQFHAICNYVSGLKAQPIIIDIGAHHGAYVIVIGKLVRHLNGKVIAVEPNPESFKILVKNVQLNRLEDTVICEQIALSDTSGTAQLCFDNSQSHIAQNKTGGRAAVQVVTAKQLFDKHGLSSADLLMIDVEGAELSVLRGIPWSSVQIGKIFCELHPYAWSSFDYNGKAMSDFLAEHEYRCFDMYLKEHKEFDREAYIGPTLFISRRSEETV